MPLIVALTGFAIREFDKSGTWSNSLTAFVSGENLSFPIKDKFASLTHA